MVLSWANSPAHSLCKIQLSDHCICSDNHGWSMSTLQNEACGPISAICYFSVYCTSAIEQDGQTQSTLTNVCYTLWSLSDELKVEETPQKATALRLAVWFGLVQHAVSTESHYICTEWWSHHRYNILIRSVLGYTTYRTLYHKYLIFCCITHKFILYDIRT